MEEHLKEQELLEQQKRVRDENLRHSMSTVVLFTGFSLVLSETWLKHASSFKNVQ